MAVPAAEWVEVDIVPARESEPERLLLDVVDPLVHEHLRERIDTWFYFWEPELRLRLRWTNAEEATANKTELARLLDQDQDEGKLREWYEAAHGKRGATYEGESGLYGAEVWELTAQDWMSGSELALAIVKHESANRLTQPREFHWQRRLHLFSNQLRADEIGLCLKQAHGYINMHFPGDLRFAAVTSAIEALFRP